MNKDKTDWLVELIGNWHDNPDEIVEGDLSYWLLERKVLAKAIRNAIAERLNEEKEEWVSVKGDVPWEHGYDYGHNQAIKKMKERLL